MSAPRTPRARRRAARRVPQSVRSATVEAMEPRTLLTALTVGYYNSLFWGAQWGVFPVDPDLTDGAVPGEDGDVGSIRLYPTAPPDRADPLGIAAADPEGVRVVEASTDFSYAYLRDNRPASIETTNFATLMTGSVTVPSDGDANPGEDVSIAFGWPPNSHGHAYVDGRLVFTNYGGQSAVNAAPPRVYREGQPLDLVLLSLRGPLGVGTRNWLGGWEPIPDSLLSPTPSVPAKSGLTLSGEPTARQVTFAITDNSTSEQRFELYRKPAGASDADYIKVNEAGINSPLVTDASAVPGTTYTYVLRGYNFVSGYSEASDPVTVTTAAAPAARQGLNGYYFNDEFWGQGYVRAQPRLGNLFVGPAAGPGAAGLGADVHDIVTSSVLDFGRLQHDPTVRPGGSPHPLIRDLSHSIVLAGKLRVDVPGTYQVFGLGDDDTYVIVNNVITSSHPFIRGFLSDPRVSPNNADQFTHPIHLDAGDHDLLVLNTHLTRTAFVGLQWIPPGQTTPQPVPDANLWTATAAPATPGAPQAADVRGTNALIALDDNATGEWKNLLVVARDADFTQDVRTLPFGILVDTGAPGANPSSLRVFDLLPNTRYFAKHVALNADGEAVSAVTEFDTGPEVVPAAPTRFFARPRGPGEIGLTWTDAAFDETGYVVQRKIGDGEFADLATLAAGATSYLDLPDPAQVPLGTVLEYRVAAVNNAGRANSEVRSLTFGGPGGTGLRQRIWNDIHPTSYEGVGAPAVDRLDPFVSHDWGAGSPAPGIGIDTFATEWVGEILIEETKAYDFSVMSTNGARLFLNDVPVIAGTWRSVSPFFEYGSEPIPLTAGQKVKVRLQYNAQNSSSASVRLRWNGPAGREDVPSVFLFPTLGPADAVDQVARRPVSHTDVSGLPPLTPGGPASIAVRWQDNAFAETGYEVQRATDAAFTQNLRTVSGGATPAAGPGSDLFVDDGGSVAGTPTPLDRNTRYYYRVRPAGAPEAAWVNAGSARPDYNTAGADFELSQFATTRRVTLNGNASVTGEQTLKLAHDVPGQISSAYLNGSFDVAADFKVNFDFQISNSTGADGMTFVIHNHRPAGNGTSQLRAIGDWARGGSGLGYGGIPNSVAVTFDIHNNIDQLGMFTGGNSPSEFNWAATRVNDPAQWPLNPNGAIDLRLAANGGIDLNSGAVYDFVGVYNNTTKVFTIEIRLASARPDSAPLFTTNFIVDLPAAIGGNEAVMGFTAASGGLASRYEVHNFRYDGPSLHGCRVCEPPPSSPELEVFVRGTTWAANPSFGQWLEANGHGDDVLGYRVDNLPIDTTVPWTNVNEVVIRYPFAPTGSGIPSPDSITLTGTHGDYRVTSVAPLGTGGTTFVLTLHRPLGVLPAPQVGTDGDRVTLRVGGIVSPAYTLMLNTLQGDANRLNSRVSSVDVAMVRSRLNRSATEATPPGGAQPYTAFADLTADGRINAQDVTAVRARLNDFLPAVPTTAGELALPVTGAALFGVRRIRPDDRPAFADLLA